MLLSTCAMTIDSKPKFLSKRSATPCKKSDGYDVSSSRIPQKIRMLTCYDRDDCFSAVAAVMTYNTTSKKMKAVDMVVGCLKRVSCLGNKNITKTQVVKANTKPPISYTVVTCNKSEDKIYTILPKMTIYGSLSYEKIVYDCKCPCPGT